MHFSNWWQFISFQHFHFFVFVGFSFPLFLFCYLFSFFTAFSSPLFLFPLNHQRLSDFLPSLSSFSFIRGTRQSALHSPFKSVVPTSCSLTILHISPLNLSCHPPFLECYVPCEVHVAVQGVIPISVSTFNFQYKPLICSAVAPFLMVANLNLTTFFVSSIFSWSNLTGNSDNEEFNFYFPVFPYSFSPFLEEKSPSTSCWKMISTSPHFPWGFFFSACPLGIALPWRSVFSFSPPPILRFLSFSVSLSLFFLL